MKKGIYLIALFMLIISVSGCSWYKMSGSGDDEEVKWLDVKLTINPEKPQPNEEVTIVADVIYGEEALTDLDDVIFEIWRANDEEHQEFTVKEVTDGSYQLKTSFEREGTYYVFAHVTAEGMHNMPKTEFIVGTPSEPETSKSPSTIMEKQEGE